MQSTSSTVPITRPAKVLRSHAMEALKGPCPEVSKPPLTNVGNRAGKRRGNTSRRTCDTPSCVSCHVTMKVKRSNKVAKLSPDQLSALAPSRPFQALNSCPTVPPCFRRGVIGLSEGRPRLVRTGEAGSSQDSTEIELVISSSG
jgi:hypothetical protein